MYTLHINGWTPPAISIAIGLREKGLEFGVAGHDWQASAEALAAFADTPELLNSLEGEFPILVTDNGAISDSYFVLEYLEDRHPAPPLRPTDAYGQWQIQALHRFFGERALPAVSSLGVAQDFGGQDWTAQTTGRFETTITPERRDAWKAALSDPANSGVMAESRRKVALLFERLDNTLSRSGGYWLLGGSYTIADISSFVLADPFLSGVLRAKIEPSQAVHEWHARVSERPAVAGVLASLEPAFLPGPEHARWG